MKIANHSGYLGLFRKTTLALSTILTALSPSMAKAKLCSETFMDGHFKQEKESERAQIHTQAAPKAAKVEDLKQSYETSLSGVQAIRSEIYGNEGVILSLISALIAHEHAWLNGDPGGAKTMISRLFFSAEIRGQELLVGKDEIHRQKREFVLQFNKLLAEGVISGFPKFQQMMERGKYEIETKDSMIHEDVILALLDEAEKANPSTHAALLSILNERQAFIGSRVVQSFLRTGVFTSNKTVPQFKRSFEDDAPTAEALLDRIGIKSHAVSQQENYNSTNSMLKKVFGLEEAKNSGKPPVQAVSQLSELRTLVDKVELSEELLEKLVLITRDLDSAFTKKLDDNQAALRQGDTVAEYFPANQFSNRSMLRLVQVMRASFVAEQIMDGVPWSELRLKMTDKDLYHIATGAIQGGPGAIRHKSIAVEIKPTIRFIPRTVVASWNPVKRTLNVDYNGDTYVVKLDLEKGTASTVAGFKLNNLTETIAAIKDAEGKANYEPKKIEFEDDGVIDAYIRKDAVEAETKEELKGILEDRQLLVSVLNTYAMSEQRLNKVYKKDFVQEAQITEAAEKLKAALKDPHATAEQRQKYSWEANQLAWKELNLMFKELSHSILAHFVAIASGNHVFAFGPPGGAKTSLARTILEAELRSVKQDAYSQFIMKFMERLKKTSAADAELFVLQFHKLMPEGVVLGFPKLNKQLESGRMEYDRSGSLANDTFIFAVLDEVEKGNPAILSSLLSVLNEREVFAGNEKVKAALRTAVLTSNKTPSEYMDSSGTDAPTIKAALDRAINKVYVANKFTEPEMTADFLKDRFLRGQQHKLQSPIYLSILSTMADKVKINPEALKLATMVHESFMGRRQVVKDQTQKANKEDARTEPYYYVPASTASNRTIIALAKQWRMAFILDQMIQGVPFENIRYTISVSDIRTFSQGLIYYGPYEMRTVVDQQGVPVIELDAGAIESLVNSPQVSARNIYVLKSVLAEASDFVEITNQILQKEVLEFRKLTGNNSSDGKDPFAHEGGKNNP